MNGIEIINTIRKTISTIERYQNGNWALDVFQDIKI